MTKVVVRPASCADHVQFAEAAAPGYLFEFAGIVRKPVYMAFHVPWVESCTYMEKQVYHHPDLASFFNRKFINYKINAGGSTPGPELAQHFNVTVYPTQLFVDSYGKVIWRYEGPMSASQLLDAGYRISDSLEKEFAASGEE